MTSGLNLVDIYFFLTGNILQFQTSDFITSIGCKFSTELNEQVFINTYYSILLLKLMIKHRISFVKMIFFVES